MTRIHRRYGLLALAGLCATSLWAQTPDWPKAKPVTMVVAFAAGSSTDTVARALAQKLGELTGGNFIASESSVPVSTASTPCASRPPSTLPSHSYTLHQVLNATLTKHF